MKAYKLKIIVVLLFFCLFGAFYPFRNTSVTPPSSGFIKANSEKISRNQKGLNFSISTKKKKYFIGDEIRVTLKFTNDSFSDYKITRRTYDRSGRFNEAGFFVEGPENGYVDPIGSHVYMTFGGGLGGADETFETAEKKITLNDYVRFDKPGTYYVYCTSSFVYEGNHKPVELGSPIMKLEIADGGKLYTMAKTIEAFFLFYTGDKKEKISAIKKLGYIGTNRACEKLISLLDFAPSYDVMLGIISCRNRDFALKKMIDGLNDPHICVNYSYLYTLAHISFPPEYYSSMRKSHFLFEEYMEKQNEYVCRYLNILAGSIKKRSGKNLADTCFLLLSANEMQKSHFRVNFPLSRQVFSETEVNEGLLKTFHLLNIADQSHLLEYRWEKMKCGEWKNVLRSFLDNCNAKSNKQKEAHDEFYLKKTTALATLRLTELENGYDACRKLIIEDMKKENPEYPISVRLSLKDENLPEMENFFLEGLCGNKSYSGQLILRYAANKILPELREHFRDFMRCDDKSRDNGNIEYIFRYLLKNDRKNILDELKKTPLSYEKYYFLCRSLREYYDDEIEAFAIASLNGQDIRMVRDMALLLAEYGSEKSIGPVLKKLSEFKEKYESTASEREKEFFRQTNPLCVSIILKRGRALNDEQKKLLPEMLLDESDRKAFEKYY